MSEKTFWPTWQENKIFTILVGVVLLVVVVIGVVVIRNGIKQYNYIGRVVEQRDTITISGEGKVIAIPDIATIQLGLVTEKKTVAAAQKENTDKMNQLNKQLKDQGVESKDIQTSNYSIYPQYDYNNGKQTLRGYQVSQTVNVKIRNLDKVGDIISAAGTLGLNQVGGLSFDIDEPETLKQEARIKALENAREKANALADIMDVKLGKVVSFNESSQYPSPIYKSYAMDSGIGGGAAVPAPDIQSGSMEIVIDATVVYEIK
jgi:uncharacterized protein YggE